MKKILKQEMMIYKNLLIIQLKIKLLRNIIINENIKHKNKILENDKGKKNIIKTKKFISIKQKKASKNNIIQKKKMMGIIKL